MLNRGSNASSDISILLRFSAFVVLFGCWVDCDLVGHGRHELIDGEIKRLLVNTMIAETPEDVEQYKKLPGAYDIEMDKDGNLIVWYLKYSKTKEEGCSVDFVTQNADYFFLEFGIWHNYKLFDCLDEALVNDKNNQKLRAINENRLAFSFSLKNEEFDKIKKGPLYGNINDCAEGQEERCGDHDGKCLEVADYSIGWARTGESVLKSYQPLGEITLFNCIANDTKTLTKETNASVDFKFYNVSSVNFCGTPMSYFNSTCFKKENIRKVKGWKIVDKNYKEQKYKNLFTFQILPVLAMRKSMQDIWGCDGECDKEAQMQRCEKMFVKFSNQDFKLLVPFNQNKKTIEQTKRQTKTFGQFENISTTLILVSSIIILIVSTVCCSICLFLSNISNEGEGKTENL